MKRARTNVGEDFGSLTPPPAEVPIAGVEAWRNERTRAKVSEHGVLLVEQGAALKELQRRLGSIELAAEEHKKTLVEIRESQVVSTHHVKQLLESVASQSAAKRDAERVQAAERSQWQRTLVSSLISLGALTVALVSLALARC